jgi:uncharacterized HAD superfamily protein
MQTKTIGYDFDGVICETMPAFHQYWKEKYSWSIFDGDSRTFEMPMPKDYDYKNISDDIEEALNLYQSFLRPYGYALEMMREIANVLNQTPIIITARRIQNREVTDEWLSHYLGIPYTLVFAEGRSKPSICEEWKVTSFVEDRFKTVGNLAHVCDHVYMPDRVWNSGREHRGFKNIHRVNNLIDVYDLMFSGEEGT